MYAPFGGSLPPKEVGNVESTTQKQQWSVQLSFGDLNDPETKIFLEKVQAFDEFIVDQACLPENATTWAGSSKTKPFSREIIEEKYCRMLKYVKKDNEVVDNMPPFIRVSLPTDYKNPNVFNCEFYDKDSNILECSPIPEDPNSPAKIIPPGSYCGALITGSIWIIGSKSYGVSWKVEQLKVFPPKGSIPRGKCLVDDPEEEESEESAEDLEDLE
jgi:hypothetical protein